MSTTQSQATDISFESGDAREVIGDGIIEIYGWVGTESLLIRMSLIEVVFVGRKRWRGGGGNVL